MSAAVREADWPDVGGRAPHAARSQHKPSVWPAARLARRGAGRRPPPLAHGWVLDVLRVGQRGRADAVVDGEAREVMGEVPLGAVR